MGHGRLELEPRAVEHYHVPGDGPALPIQEVTTAKGSKETVTLSKWGEFVNIAVPPLSQTIPYAKVSG